MVEYAERQAGQADGGLPLSDVLEERRRFLCRTVEEIETDLESRRRLHEAISAQLESDLREMRAQRRFLDDWGTGYEASVESRKAALERELAGLRQARLQEDLAFWRDSVALHKELREAQSDRELAGLAGGLETGGDDG
jgi:uncharacterized protein YydD (DUF2326 family)